MNIEKVTSNRVIERLPGVVDILLNNTANCYHDYFVKNIAPIFSSTIIDKLHKAGVTIGRNYDSRGIDIVKLMASKVDPNTVYEVCALTYNSLTEKQKHILSRHNIIVHDLMEGGHMLTAHKVKTVTGCIDSIPIFLLCTVANSIVTNNVSQVLTHSANKKRALIPIHKARQERLDMLEALYDIDVLNECEWSLYLHDSETGVAGDFNTSPNLSTARWSDANVHPFVQRHKQILPKVLDHISTFAECLPLNKKYHSMYKWHVACETYQNRLFISEKTFKAFIGGHIPLTVAQQGFNDCIEKYLGFKMPGDYDHLAGDQRIRRIAEIVKYDVHDYTDVIEYNHARIMDVDTVSAIIANSINREYCS